MHQLFRKLVVEVTVFNFEMGIYVIVSYSKWGCDPGVASGDVVFRIMPEVILIVYLDIITLQTHPGVGSESSVVESNVAIPPRAIFFVQNFLSLVQLQLISLVLARTSEAMVATVVIKRSTSKILNSFVDVLVARPQPLHPKRGLLVVIGPVPLSSHLVPEANLVIR